MNYWCITLHLHTRRLGSVYPRIAPDVVEILRKHRWPGNLRELSNLMEYLVNVVPSGEVIDSTLLPPNLLNNGTTEQSDVTEVSEAHPHSMMRAARRWRRWKSNDPRGAFTP